MTFLNRIRLIPRNNWDYRVRALLPALAGIYSNRTQAPNVAVVFHQKPIWTNSGRCSLYAILRSLVLPAGARIGVPLFCCSVVFNAISQAGLAPRFLDSDVSNFNLSLEDLRNKSSELAAVVAVHMFGNPCDMDAIVAVANGMPVIEDCAQSVFSRQQGKQTGFAGTASFFSFRCGKYISAGEGSAIFCKDPDLHARVERIVDGFNTWSGPEMLLDALMTFVKATLYNRPWYGLAGYPIGMRLDKKLNLTAKDGFETGKIKASHLSLLDARIAGFEEKINIQRRHAKELLNALAPGNFCLPAEDRACSRNWFQFPLRFQNQGQRDAMADYLLSQGIDTAKYLDGIIDDARSNYGYTGDCPNAEVLSKTTLLVPIHYTLSDSDIEHIACSINDGSRMIRTRRG